MKRCLCPCSGYVERDEYRRMVRAVIMLLSGKSEDLVKSMRRQMLQASKDLRFEEAARIRDVINAVERTLEVQNVSFFHLKDQDVIASAKGDDDLFAIAVLSFRRGKLLSGDSFVIRNRALDEEEVPSSAVEQYYGDGAFVPKEIMVSHAIEQPEVISEWLSEIRGNRVLIRVPARGRGGESAAVGHEKRERCASSPVSEGEFREVLGADRPTTAPAGGPGADRRVRHFQHSRQRSCRGEGGFQGSETVAKKAYRHFKMQGFSDQDDPAMIHQTVLRRVRHRDEDPLPDLLLIDGGKSQLNAAVAALTEELGDRTPPVAAIAKVREEGQQERIFLPGRKNHVPFPVADSGLRLLMQVRDEAHRVAQSFQAKTHQKTVIKSALDEVPGIGPKKRVSLLTAFGSVERILAAADTEVLSVPGVGRRDLERIREHFRRAGTSPDGSRED